MRKQKFVNTGDSNDQNNDRVYCFMNGDPIQNWSICKFVSHSAVCQIDVETMFNQLEYIVANTPVNETVTSEVLGAVFIRVATSSFWHLYILQCALASTCKDEILNICFLLQEYNYSDATDLFICHTYNVVATFGY